MGELVAAVGRMKFEKSTDGSSIIIIILYCTFHMFDRGQKQGRLVDFFMSN